MTTIETIMYSLGQLARAVYPAGGMPPGLHDKILQTPATGFSLLLKTPAARKAVKTNPEVCEMIAKLPADLADLDGGVATVDQAPYWSGWYHYATAIDRSKRLKAADLERAGRALFGERWKSDLADALQVNDRRIREWLSGSRNPSAGVWADIAALLRQRSNEGLALLRELDGG